MTEGPIEKQPPRLAEHGGETGRLLSGAEAEFRKRLDESGAWGRIERTRQRRTAASWALSAAAVTVGVVAISVGASSLLADRGQLALTPEPVATNAVREIEKAPAARLLPRETPAAVPAPVPVARASAPHSSDGVDEAACRKLGKSERAFECFRTLSRGDGVSAEVALYEATRLSAERMNDAPRALALLDEHKTRFPTGALRGEMDWLRVQSLERAGRFDEALAASEALLATPVGRELSSDLHWLRGRIFQEVRADCSRAASEFVALLGESSARGDDAEMRRALCLEKLGRAADAAVAYEQYLRRPDARRATEARARLSVLRP